MLHFYLYYISFVKLVSCILYQFYDATHFVVYALKKFLCLMDYVGETVLVSVWDDAGRLTGIMGPAWIHGFIETQVLIRAKLLTSREVEYEEMFVKFLKFGL